MGGRALPGTIAELVNSGAARSDDNSPLRGKPYGPMSLPQDQWKTVMHTNLISMDVWKSGELGKTRGSSSSLASSTLPNQSRVVKGQSKVLYLWLCICGLTQSLFNLEKQNSFDSCRGIAHPIKLSMFRTTIEIYPWLSQTKRLR